MIWKEKTKCKPLKRGVLRFDFSELGGLSQA